MSSASAQVAEAAEQPSCSAAAAAALLTWAAAEGASVSRVTAGSSPLGGLGLFAATDVPSGQELLRCPLRLVLRASMALDDPVIGGPLTVLRGELGEQVVDDRLLLRLLLLHLHAQGAGGRFWPYLAALQPDRIESAALFERDCNPAAGTLKHCRPATRSSPHCRRVGTPSSCGCGLAVQCLRPRPSATVSCWSARTPPCSATNLVSHRAPHCLH